MKIKLSPENAESLYYQQFLRIENSFNLFFLLVDLLREALSSRLKNAAY